MRFKALVEIYTMHSFAQLQNHIFFKKLVEFAKICEKFQKFCEISQFFKPIFCEKIEIAAVQKDANLVDLEKCCQTHIFLQKFVLIQPRTSPPKICTAPPVPLAAQQATAELNPQSISLGSE